MGRNIIIIMEGMFASCQHGRMAVDGNCSGRVKVEAGRERERECESERLRSVGIGEKWEFVYSEAETARGQWKLKW